MNALVEQDGGWRRSPFRLLLWAIPTALLIAPAVAMQFTEEVQWTAFDFIFGAVLLYGTTALIDLAVRKGGSTSYRFAAGLAVVISFLLIWINGAVGIIGNEDNPLNLLFLGVIVVAVAGSVIARFEARGMARAMYAAALAQFAIAVAVLVIGWGAHEPPGLMGVAMLITIFAALWLLSGGLFAKAAHDAALRGQG